MSDYEGLDFRGVKVVSNRGIEYVYLPSVQKAFGGEASIIQIANTFMVPGNSVVDEIIDASWNKEALRALYNAHTDRAPGSVANRAQMKDAVRKASHYRFVTREGHRDYEYPEWKLGSVPLCVLLTGQLKATGFKERLLAQSEVKQRVAHEKEPKAGPDFTQLREQMKEIDYWTHQMQVNDEKFKEAFKPYAQHLAMLSMSKGMLGVMMDAPKEPVSTNQVTRMHGFRRLFDRFVNESLKAGANPPHGQLQVWTQVHSSAARASMSLLHDDAFLKNVELFVENIDTAPPELLGDLSRCLAPAYSALALTDQSEAASIDLFEMMRILANHQLEAEKGDPDRKLRRHLRVLDTQWIHYAATYHAAASGTRSALSILSKSSEIPTKAVTAFQELLNAGGALLWKLWTPSSVSPALNSLMAALLRGIMLVNRMSVDEGCKLGSMLDKNDWQGWKDFRDAKGWGGKVLNGKFATGVFLLFNLAAIVFIVAKRDTDHPLSDSDMANIAKFGYGALGNIFKTLTLEATTAKAASALFCSVGGAFTAFTAYLALRDDLEILDATSCAWHTAGIGSGVFLIASGLLADSTGVGIPVGIALKWLGATISLAVTARDIYTFATKPFAGIWCRQILENFRESQEYYDLSHAPPGTLRPESEPPEAGPRTQMAKTYDIVHGILGVDFWYVSPNAAPYLLGLGFPNEHVEFLTNEKSFALAAIKEAKEKLTIQSLREVLGLDQPKAPTFIQGPGKVYR